MTNSPSFAKVSRLRLVCVGFVAFTAWCSILLDARADQTDDVRIIKARAKELFENGRYAEALERYAELKKFPRAWSIAIIGSARCRHELGNHEQALHDLGLVISREPHNADAHYYRGHSHFAKGELDKALADYSSAIEAAPNVPRYYHARAAAYFALGDFMHLLADYDTELRLEPRNVEALTSRGLVFNGLKKFHRALKDFSKALEINPSQTDAFGGRAQAYNQLGNWRAALDDLESYSTEHPKDLELLLARSILHVKLGSIKSAIQICTRAIAIHPNAAKPCVLRGDNYCRIGDLKSALLDYQRAAGIADELSAVAHSRLALFYATCPDKQLRDIDSALKHARKCCEITQRGKWPAVAVLAIVHQKAGRVNQAKRCQEEVLRIAPANEKKKARGVMERWFQQEEHSLHDPFVL